MTESVELSIIIVNYNGKKFLADCIASIERYFSCRYEIILVDNASADGSVEFIKDKLPSVKLIESKENTGFTGGNNLGAQYASGDLLLLLNNDTLVKSDMVEILAAFVDNPNLGIAGCALRYGDGRLQCSVGYEHTPLRIALSWLGLQKFAFLPSVFRRAMVDPAFYATRQSPVAWVSGAFLVIRKQLWNALGGFDDEYFMYMEDVDLCYRARLLGNSVAYFPSTQIIHYEGAGKVWIGERALLTTMRSYVIFTRKFFGEVSLWWLKAMLAPIMCARAVYYLPSFLTGNSVKKEKGLGFLKATLAVVRG